MIQHQAPLEYPVAPCGCGKQPYHYVTRGSELHHLEHLPCKMATPKYPTFAEAAAMWNYMRADKPVVIEEKPKISDTVRQLRKKNG